MHDAREVQREQQRRSAGEERGGGRALAELLPREQQADGNQQHVEGRERDVVAQAAHRAEVDEQVREPESRRPPSG